MKKYLLFLFFIGYSINAQVTYPVNGVKDKRNKYYAFTNATIYKDHQTKLEKATLVVKDGKIVSVSNSNSVPKGAIAIDCTGKSIYPSFVESLSGYGVPELKKSTEKIDYIQQISKKKGAYHWNEAIKPETEAHLLFSANGEEAKKMRKLGFGSVVTHQKDGIARGSGALVTLGSQSENESILKKQVAAFYSFRKGISKQGYPSSLMGIIALLRQTYLDAEWYQNYGYQEEENLSLQFWNEQQKLPSVFLTGNWQEVLRADKVGDENKVQYIIKGGGDEYKRIDAIKKTGAKLIVPVNFPDAYEVNNPIDAHYIELKHLKNWELAPYNLSMLDEANIQFAITSDGLKDPSVLLKNVKKAIKKGLKKETALQALTSTPAEILNINDLVGSLNKGLYANFIIASDDIFEEGEILENWVQGEQFIIKQKNTTDYSGLYELVVFDADDEKKSTSYQLEVSGKIAAPKMKIVIDDSTKIKVKNNIQDDLISLVFTPQDKERAFRLSGSINGNTWKGKGQNMEGAWIDWTVKNRKPLEKKEEDKKEEDEDKPDISDEIGAITYPFLPYGWTESPKQDAVLFKNATVWTNTDDGILENADVLIRNGKISQVGKNLAGGGAKEIDATDKHLTCGIIDEHSHISLNRGVNEGTQASSAEVRIGDVISCEDVNIYRQLAGGVTTAQLLHGSANPIGGQSAIIKFRWGSTAEEMKFEEADGFIKFALGENVTHGNWGSGGRVRFPQTRMGVEQVFIDHFTQAQDYEKAMRQNPNQTRKDLEMETLLEIMNKERFITCHSYVQSEITMLMRVAEQFDFNINTFTHILEGYKIADKMKEHGVNASTFSDWWMYKFEVNDAIPHNAAILNEMGITTAINSDDAEMGRRLNNEAAKAVKYGGMSEEDAWKMVTLNPAKILHLDNRVGSLEAGKDADIVLWSTHPLSVYSKAEQTYVDGRLLWDIEQDEAARLAIQKERNRLIQKMIKAKDGGEKTQKAPNKKQHLYHCDDVEDEGN